LPFSKTGINSFTISGLTDASHGRPKLLQSYFYQGQVLLTRSIPFRFGHQHNLHMHNMHDAVFSHSCQIPVGRGWPFHLLTNKHLIRHYCVDFPCSQLIRRISSKAIISMFVNNLFIFHNLFYLFKEVYPD